MNPARKLHPAITALIVIVLIGIAATAVIVIHASSQKPTATSTSTNEIVKPTATDTAPSITYKDGTYNATGSYSSPAGPESIELTVTLKSGIITSTSLVADATSGAAIEYQASFASAYKDSVVGKNIDHASLSRVAGSSLTSHGYNEALDLIKKDAKA